MNTKQTEARAGQKAAAKFQIKGHCGDWHHERKAKSVSIALKIFFFQKHIPRSIYCSPKRNIQRTSRGGSNLVSPDKTKKL